MPYVISVSKSLMKQTTLDRTSPSVTICTFSKIVVSSRAAEITASEEPYT